MNSFFSRGTLAIGAAVCIAACANYQEQGDDSAPCTNEHNSQAIEGSGGAGGSGGGGGDAGGQAVVDPLACETIWDCPRDCNFYGCAAGKCTPMAKKPDGSSCSMADLSKVAFCAAGACTPGCDYVTDCEFKDCSDITCSGHTCQYQPNPSNCAKK